MAFFNHGGFLALVEHHLAHIGAVDVQDQKHHKGDDNVCHGIVKLGVAIAPELFLVNS